MEPHIAAMNLLLYLWAPNQRACSCPGVRLPDTLLLTPGGVRHWLFTNKRGQILLKSKQKARDPYEIMEAMLKPHRKELKKRGSTYVPVALHVIPGEEKQRIFHLDRDTLQSVIYQRCTSNGLMQSHISQSTGHSHILYLAQWSDGQFIVNKVGAKFRNHRRKKLDTLPNIAEDRKSGTLPELEPLVGGVQQGALYESLSRLCDNMANHIYEVSPQKYRVQRMSLVFKSDGAGYIWLLWCNHIEVTCDKPESPEKRRLSISPSLTRRNSRSNSLSPSKGELVRKKSLLSAAPKHLPHVIHPTDFGHIGLLPNIEDKPLFHAYHKSDYGLADIVVKPTEGSTIRVLGRNKGRVNLD